VSVLEINKNYKIIYDDGSKQVVKDLKLICKNDPVFLKFENLVNGKIEHLPISCIKRAEEVDSK